MLWWRWTASHSQDLKSYVEQSIDRGNTGVTPASKHDVITTVVYMPNKPVTILLVVCAASSAWLLTTRARGEGGRHRPRPTPSGLRCESGESMTPDGWCIPNVSKQPPPVNESPVKVEQRKATKRGFSKRQPTCKAGEHRSAGHCCPSGTEWLSSKRSCAAVERIDPDPARVAGSWTYRTRSNCGSVEGVGAVSFRWDPESRGYNERGHVFWSDSGTTIRWWGLVRYDSARRLLTGRGRNSLGDTVNANWRLEGAGPDRLVVEWAQANGCRGRGVATR